MKNMKKFLSSLLLVLMCVGVCGVAAAQRPKAEKKTATAKDGATKTGAASQDELNAELETISVLPLAERVERLRTFVKANARSPVAARAAEMLTGARAALGDERLQAGDTAAGVELFRLAVAEAPAEMSEKLFVGVVSQLPGNLFIRGARTQAFDLARRIEATSKTDPQRLLVLTTFYLSVEQPDEAARIAEQVIQLRPDNAAAHQALGTAHRIALRLDAAAKEFSRALELDPRSTGARRSLADMKRAAGLGEEALALYRELATADPQDAGAHTGVVLSLFDVGQKEEAERELAAALETDPRNMALLAGAAYWHAVQGNGARALELAANAVAVEPRYTWAQIVLARALIAQKRPLDAETSLRYARRYGQFPTLDYELASTMAAAGLYDEAAEELARTFTIRDGQIETQLAGRVAARSDNFIELLALERRAAIFQPVAADTAANARMLKGLLAFHQATNPAAGTPSATIDEAAAVAAATDFVAGNDEMRAFRHLYAASRLVRRGVGFATALESTEAAAGGVEAALDSPAASVAVAAEELRDIRARVIAEGRPTNFPAVARNRLSNVLRGRIEEVAGRALLGRGAATEAVVRLKRATGVLPEGTTWWRDALWYLGAALDASGNQTEALAALLRSYDRRAPDPARHAVIEGLYRKVNGSLEGLDEKLGAASVSVSSVNPPTTPPTTTTTVEPPASPTTTAEETTTTNRATVNETNASTTPPTTEPVSVPSITMPDTTPTTTTTTAPVVAVPAPEPTPATPNSEQSQTPPPEPTPAPVSDTSSQPRPRTVASASNGACRIAVSENEITLRSNGGSRTITVTLDGASERPTVSPTTTNWADIVVLSEPQPDPTTFRFTITSVSRMTGLFTVTFNSPCGKQFVQITVK